METLWEWKKKIFCQMTAKRIFEYWTTLCKKWEQSVRLNALQKTAGHGRLKLLITLPLFLVLRTSGETKIWQNCKLCNFPVEMYLSPLVKKMNVAKNARVITEALLFVVTIFRTTPAFKLQIKLNFKCFSAVECCYSSMSMTKERKWQCKHVKHFNSVV